MPCADFADACRPPRTPPGGAAPRQAGRPPTTPDAPRTNVAPFARPGSGGGAGGRSFVSRRGFLAAGLAAGACLASLDPPPASAREVPPAERLIEELGERTIGVLNRTGADEAARIRGLAELLEGAVDFEAVARMVLGRNWRHASDAQRRDYVGLFRAHTLDTLSQRIGSYTGSQRFVVTGSRPAGADDTVVSARVLYTDQPPLDIAWRIRGEQRLMVVDVIVEQVSLVVTNRSEFDSIVGQRGIDGLLREMRTRVSSP
jgi:phospholipid transport system substrate-binding protein